MKLSNHLRPISSLPTGAFNYSLAWIYIFFQTACNNKGIWIIKSLNLFRQHNFHGNSTSHLISPLSFDWKIVFISLFFVLNQKLQITSQVSHTTLKEVEKTTQRKWGNWFIHYYPNSSIWPNYYKAQLIFNKY